LRFGLGDLTTVFVEWTWHVGLLNRQDWQAEKLISILTQRAVVLPRGERAAMLHSHEKHEKARKWIVQPLIRANLR
jgi:hypothetical protein